jgi:predicted nucleic acid-binding protein
VSSNTSYYLLDSNAYDFVIADDGLPEELNELIEQSRIVLLLTYVQYTELVKMHEAGKHQKFAACMLINATVVPACGVIPDKSPFGLSIWADDDASHRISETTEGNINDALLVETAHHHNAVLVTDDRRCRNRATRVGVLTLRPPEFIERMRLLSSS